MSTINTINMINFIDAGADYGISRPAADSLR